MPSSVDRLHVIPARVEGERSGDSGDNSGRHSENDAVIAL